VLAVKLTEKLHCLALRQEAKAKTFQFLSSLTVCVPRGKADHFTSIGWCKSEEVPDSDETFSA